MFYSRYNSVQIGGANAPQIRPITDLRNTTEIPKLCHTKREPPFITKNGYGNLVVMSIEAYEELVETAKTDMAISEAEAEFEKDGVLLNARKSLANLRKSKHISESANDIIPLQCPNLPK